MVFGKYFSLPTLLEGSALLVGVLCRKWHRTTLQEDKVVLGRGENWQFFFRKQLSVNKGIFLIHEEHRG